MYNSIISAARITVYSLGLLSIASSAKAQAVTEIVTDYSGYWKSASASINSVKPDNNHNLLSFSYNSVRYSTGVNDALLTNKGLAFTAGDFRAMPLQNFTGTVNSNTKIGLGAMADGVYNGTTAPAPSRAIAPYLNDGINGLNIGTCVANLPAGTMFLSVSNFQVASIGDGVPDILVTQTADPSNTYDTYEFTDINGVRVGNSRDIVLNNIAPVGNWDADFFEATGSTVLSSGFTQTSRALRLWAADLSTFGINSGNIGRIAYFKIGLSGSSDIAFVAYNTKALSFPLVLPVQFFSFTAKKNMSTVSLEWTTNNDAANYHFFIESSKDGINYESLDSVMVNATGKYAYAIVKATDGLVYYRIKHADISGNIKYSRIIQMTTEAKLIGAIYPNPASNYVNINHLSASGKETVSVYSMNGSLMVRKQVTQGTSQTRIDIPMLAKGCYHVSMANGTERFAELLVVK